MIFVLHFTQLCIKFAPIPTAPTAAGNNNMTEKTGKYPFLAEPFHCDFSNRLFMGHLGNHLLNAADFHANDRGFGMNYLMPLHRTWVLSRLVIEMEEMPKAYDRFCVETWVESAMRLFTSRNFAVTGEDGQVYGYGRSVWAMIDMQTRQPVDILAMRDGQILDYVETEKPCPIAKPARVKMGDGATLVRTVQTNYSDVDVNGHINSVKYIEHMLDLFPISWYQTHRVRRFEVAYVAEAHGGDLLDCYREQVGEGEYCIRIIKKVQETGENTEVVRGKVIFV